MKTFAFASFLSLLTLNSAAPTQVESRTPGNVLICTGEDYTGTCETISAPFYTCQKLEAPYFKNVGSFRPDAGAYCRITYTADSCTTHGDAFIWPDSGAPNLHHWDDVATGQNIDAGSMMTSFLCQECSGCTVKE
ncbi:uncharacterized protein BDR25DRAFT_302244 [Lindgomyces ingoldianus]|uniref:Uncharacterized protein n=1 Tax=Lindgomyces ingoldianus TaxID=673940 RepID=A0ACB6R3B9_9PLEO|nr:uncharacterized protein BDR25DRAFT_302244 [Lindgomyces ingoldianus]KAF2473290.1 hypothetical protein BDR25DRAFT_302244 [Lindgomyces ingoldianus]